MNDKPFPHHRLYTALALMLPGALAAQPSTLEEVVVTANKMGGATVQELPNAVQVMSGEELQARGAMEFSDFAGSVPGLQFQDLGPGDKEYIIRGTNSSGPSTVGVFFDDAVITGSNKQDGSGRNADIKLIDIERVEVLNGPQGTQYGANSMSGVIRYLPQKPDTGELSGFAGADFSQTRDGSDNHSFNGMINVPVIADELALRAVGWTVDNSGWVDQERAAGGPRENINDEDTWGGRIMARYTPGDRLTLDAFYLRQNTEVGGSSRYTPKGVTSFGDPDSGYPPVVARDDYENTDITQSPWEDDMTLYGLTASYEMDIGTVVATVNNFERDIDFTFDSSPVLFFFGVPIPGVTFQPQSRDILSSEIRFSSSFAGPLQVLAGVFAQREDSDFQGLVVTMDDQGRPVLPFIPGPEHDALAGNGNAFFGRTVSGDLDQEAVFGELSYDLGEQWQLVAGLRYFQSEQTSLESTLHDFGSAEASGPFSNDSEDDKTTGKLSVSYQPSLDLHLYATAAQGFRVGGLNQANISFSSGIPPAYGPDELMSYEGGIKSNWLDDRLSLDAAIYHIDWDDMQVKAMDNASGIPYVTNAGEAEIDGLEFNLGLLLSQNWELQLGGSYIDAELTKDQPLVDEGEDRGRAGDRIPNVPKTQGYAAVTWSHEIPWGDFSLRADMNYRGSTDIRFDTASPLNYELDSYLLTNLRGTLETGGGWTFTLYAKNLTDEQAEYDAISTFQDPLAVVGARPRTVGLSLRRDF